MSKISNKRILFVVNVDWFFISHRLPIAIAAKENGYHVTIATTNTGRFEELKNLGFQLYDLNVIRSGTNPFLEIAIILKLIKIFRIVKPTIVHNITLKMAIYSSIATHFAFVPKVVNAISGLGYNFTLERKTIPQKIIYKLMKFAFRNKDSSFIFQNPADLNLFRSLGFNNGNKMYLIKGAGVDLDLFVPSKDKCRTGTNFILTSRMLKDKGISEYLAACKIVSQRYPATKFILVGDLDIENLASYTEKELRQELIGSQVNWVGFRDDILELLWKADVMVFPSYREGLPKSLVEAAAVGLPIITTDAIGCRECVDDGINGFLVPVKDPISLANKMIKFIQDPYLIQKMGRESRLKAEREFSLKMVIEKTFQIYEC